jgi:pimeloyl-ACP methyl ester carboxylesterase
MALAPRLQPTRAKHFALLLLLLPLAGLAAIPSATEHLRAASLLLRIQNPNDHSALAHYHTYAVTEADSELTTPNGNVRARLYSPLGRLNPPGMVVVHGVHHLGVNEPRLMAFSRALAQSGIQVFTPELPDIADYQITHGSVDIIGIAAQHFARQIGSPVGILGLSFAGGESLLAAADPRYANSIAFVMSIGAHKDMHRVAEFFVSGHIARPDGSIVTMKPHEYGPLVLMYSHLGEFFPAADVPAAHETLKLLLYEDVPDSKLSATKLSTSSQAKMALLYQHDSSIFNANIETAIAHHAAEMATVSPHKQLQSLHKPVLLLHGAGDDVIPATEMLWLAKDVPDGYLRDALVTPLLSHVDIAREPPIREKLALVHLMAQLLELTDESRSHSLTKN